MSGPRLADLLADVEVLERRGSVDIHIGHIRSDSRLVEPGDLFVCLPGYRTEGGEKRADRHLFVPEALRRCAAALVVEREPDTKLPAHLPVVRVRDCWAAIAALSCGFYGQPSRQLRMVGVTGTSGKTSTTYFIDSVLSAAGLPAARLGTIEYKLGSVRLPASQTTPEAPEMQQLLRRALDEGAAAVVMEVSSHALELRRVQGIAYDVAVFTNLSQDHLNFHPDMHSYLRAKGRLFEELGSGGKDAVAVVNRDDPASEYIEKVNRGRLLTYGISPRADVRAEDVSIGQGGSRFRARTPAGDVDVSLAHLGEYSVHNALAAAATGVALGLPLDEIARGIDAAPQVPGRFELIDCGQRFAVIVDYAHKPDALERVIRSVRGLRPRRVITVFGCGGDRDRGKRPIMGAIAARLSDVAVVTSDNPRSESPEAIIEEICGGIPADSAAEVVVEPDRARAIDTAMRLARAEDAVIIAGKGHENYQLLGDRRIHFDDREMARQALARRTDPPSH